ncbi:hypothetical protein [Cupriavidus sp. TMH.W2]|uniref:hypothetical protein n=1 Tax=Cupriavidus sp. TMH.W2 TaxID=3434465 RepID=UPI003D76D9B8
MHARQVRLPNGLTVDVEHYQKSGKCSRELGRCGNRMGALSLNRTREEVLSKLDELRAIVGSTSDEVQ